MNVRSLLSIAALAILLPLGIAAQTAKPVTPAAATAAANKNNQLDINTASPDQLMQIPGIGEAYARRIIDGRPYTAKNQLVSRGIVPKATYDKISSQIIARRPPKN